MDNLIHFQKMKEWTGKWIWMDETAERKNTYYYFRKEFNMQDIKTCTAFITAETSYILHINGVIVGRGPVQSQPWFQYYDSYDVSGFLRKGINCAGIIVYLNGTREYTRGGLLLEILQADGAAIVTSDASWRCSYANAWSSDAYLSQMHIISPFQEFFDARKVPAGWNYAGYDDIEWMRAVEINGLMHDEPPGVLPWSCLVPRDIPHMRLKKTLPDAVTSVEETLNLTNRTRQEDLSISLSACGNDIRYSIVKNESNLLSAEGQTTVRNSTEHFDHLFDGVYDPQIVLDFGRVVNAFIELDIDGAEGGVVEIGFVERLIDKRFNNSIECQFACSYTMKEGKQVFKSFAWKAFRYVKFKFKDCYRDIRINSIHAVETNYPFDECGIFSSNNDKLNKLFDISRYTIKLCCNDSIMDTPWREQAQWSGDVSAVTLSGIYSCFGDTILPSKFIKETAENQYHTGFIANLSNTVDYFKWSGCMVDYSLWWVMGLWNHYMYTGNENWIHMYYPHVVKMMYSLNRYIDKYGLLNNLPYLIFIDHAFMDKRGENATINAIFYGTLEYIGKMAEMKNDEYVKNLILQLRSKLKQNYCSRLYSKGKACIVDCNCNGQHSENISEHANMSAILWGLCDDDMAEQIVEKMYIENTIHYVEANPFFTKVVLQALVRMGKFHLGMQIIKNRWIARMVDKGASSVYEEWGLNGSWRGGHKFITYLRSQSHAWSAYPAEFLIREVAGFRIHEPGCCKIELKPYNINTDYQIAIPIPQGLVHVEYKNGHSTISVPAGVEVID